MQSIEYQINAHITLKLEFLETIIYIDNVIFIACKSLLLNTSVDELEELEYITSIDDLEQRLESPSSIFTKKIAKMSPETRFWAHCSNIQAGVENDYDTRLLHSNLAFPLLKKLVTIGDLGALRVFKEEIVKRLESGFPSVIYFLINESYTDYISREDLIYAILNFSEARALLGLERIIGCKLAIVYDNYDVANSFIVENKHVKGFNISFLSLEGKFDSFLPFTSLTFLSLVNCGIKTIPDLISTLEKIEYLDLGENELSQLPHLFGLLKGIKEIYLDDNIFTTFPEPIKNLVNLKVLSISGNNLEEIPSYVWDFKKLYVLNLSRNNIRVISDSIGKLENLEELYLLKNPIEKLPESINNLKYLHILDLKTKNNN